MAAPKRTGLGRGIGALIPSQPTSDDGKAHPTDLFFPNQNGAGASRQTPGAVTTGSNGVGSTTAPGASNRSEEGPELVPVPGARLAFLSPYKIVPNPQQPRKDFDAEDLAELVHSIREIGILQPIVVREIPGQDTFELIMGERRLRASKEVGLESIPVIIRDTADEDMLRDALLENLHRSQLNPLEEASAYQQLLADFGITQEQLATRIGRSRPQISNTLRLLKLPPAVQLRVAAGVLSAGHARAILAVVEPEAMQRLADRIVNEELSVRAAEAIAQQAPAKPKPKAVAGGRMGQLNEIAEHLGDRLDTRVKVTLGAKKGLISIEFATISDLNRILTELGEKPFGG